MLGTYWNRTIEVTTHDPKSCSLVLNAQIPEVRILFSQEKAYVDIGVETDPAALLHLPHKPHVTQGYTGCARASCIL